jgi:carboxyl-terminal processing protease
MNEKLYLSDASVKKRKLNPVDIIDQRYVDEVNTDLTLWMFAGNGILQNLDHSASYISTEEASRANDLRGNFVGIGIVNFYKWDTLRLSIRGPNQSRYSKRR